MSDMTAIKTIVTDYFKSRDIKFSYDDDPATGRAIAVPWSLCSLNLTPHVILDRDGTSLAVGAMLPMRVPAGKLLDAFDVVNAINSRYRWVCFYVDTSDNTIMMRADANVDPTTAGPIALNLVLRMTHIANDAYPRIVKALF